MWKRLASLLLRLTVVGPFVLPIGLQISADRTVAATLPPVATATSTLDMQVHVGFDGFYKAGGWLPVTAFARNEGPPLDGRVELAAGNPASLSGNYSAAALLPTHSSKRVSFAAPAPAADQNRHVALTAGGRTLLSQTIPVSALSPQDYLYGVVSPNGDALDLLRGVRQFGGSVSVAHLTLDDIPAGGPALNDVDALIIDDTATATLSAAQRATLVGWVSSGGQLILAGGIGAAQTLSGLTELAPVSLQGSVVLDVGVGLSSWTQSSTADATTVAVGLPVPGSIVRRQAGNVPLVVDRSFGDGWVTFLAMPAATPTLHYAPGGVLAWQHILTASRHPLNALRVDPRLGGGGTNAVYTLPEAALPSGQLLAWLIFAYILVVGPLNFLLLRGLDRRELLWVTIPLVSLVFAGGSYLLARQLKGSDIIVNTVTVARQSAGPAAAAAVTIDGAVGIFSPGRTSYDVLVGGGLGITPLSPGFSSAIPRVLTVISEGASSLVQNVQVERWSMQAFATHGMGAAAGSPIETSLSLSGATISGWIRNSGRDLLQGVTLAIGSDRASLTDLMPGEQRDVRLVLSGSVPPVNGGPGRPPVVLTGGRTSGDRTRQSLLATVLDGGSQSGNLGDLVGGPQVFAFSGSAPFSVAVSGHHIQQHGTTLYIVPVSVTMPPGQSALPYGLAQRELLQNSGVTTKGAGPWLALGTTAVFQFHVPRNDAGRNWGALHVRLNLSSFGRPPAAGAVGTTTVALYNWSSATWDPQPGFAQGVFTVSQPAAYVDPRGLIRLQIGGGNGQQEIQTLDVALDGATA
ncbi:MAG: hypothetical protein ACR2JY_22725 [Chloroflexota bacterium]